MRNRCAVVTSGLVLACAAGTAMGTIRVWALTGGGSFSSGSNWSPAGAPVAVDQLILSVPGSAAIACDGLAPITAIEQYRAGLFAWTSTVPHTVTTQLSVANQTSAVGTLSIQMGEMNLTGSLSVGVATNAVGSLEVVGAGSVLRMNGGVATFGAGGSQGRLRVRSGGEVVSERGVTLGAGTGRTSFLEVDGVGSRFTNTNAAGPITLGMGAGLCELIVSNSGVLATAGDVRVSDSIGISANAGRVSVSSAALPISRLEIGGGLSVGHNTSAGVAGGDAMVTVGGLGHVVVAGDIDVGDPDAGGTAVLTVDHGSGAQTEVRCRDLRLHGNGELRLVDGLMYVGGVLSVPGGNFVLDTGSASAAGTMVLLGSANLDTLRVGVTNNGFLISQGDVACATSVALGEGAGSFGQLDNHTSGSLTVGGALEVGRAGRGEYYSSGLATTSVGQLLLGRAVGGNGNVFLQNAAFSCTTASIGRAGGGSVGVMEALNGVTYTCAGATSIYPGGVVNWSGASYSSGITEVEGGILNAAGVLAGRIGGGSGLIVATGDLTMGDGGSPNGYGTGANLDVGANRVTVLDEDHAVGSATIAGGVLDAPNGWEVPLGGLLNGFGTVGACVALGRVNAESSGLLFDGPATIAGGLTGTYAAFLRGLTAEGTLSSSVFTERGTTTTITGFASIGDGSSLGADLHGTLVTSDDALILNDDDGVGGDDFSLYLGFGTVFAQSIVQIDAGAFLRGVGSVQVPRLAVGGEISPGMNDGEEIGTINTSGVLRPSGSYAHFHIDLAGAGEGEADAVYAGDGILLSNAEEGATLTVREINGYVPSGGDRIQILGGASISGEFATVNLPAGWSVQYEANGVYLFYGCAADFTGNGAVDGDDVIAFFEAWDTGATEADVNGDGSTDGDDVIYFFGHWDSGC